MHARQFAYDSNPNLRKVVHVSVIGWAGADNFSASGFGTVYGSTKPDDPGEPIGVTLSSWEGNDVLTASGGQSSLVGGPGDDTLTSGPGSGAPTDYVYGGSGNDTIDTATNSPDKDGIYCDEKADVLSQPYPYPSDSLKRNASDIELVWFGRPTSYPGGCDHVTIA